MHPSPLYQALTEGLLLFLILWFFSRRPRPRCAAAGLFALCYGTFRFITEFFRTPDAHIGYLYGDWLTMGQLLSLPLAASNTSELDSIVRGQNGRVVAIGGLMRQASTGDTDQLPGADKVPVLGALFRNKNRVNQKRELVVLIKPTIVEGASNWNDDLLDAGRRIEQLDPRARGVR